VPASPTTVVLSPATLQRLQGMLQQADAQIKQVREQTAVAMNATLTIALEAMGAVGITGNLDITTGVVTLQEQQKG
jgi:hypothetical protein